MDVRKRFHKTLHVVAITVHMKNILIGKGGRRSVGCRTCWCKQIKYVLHSIPTTVTDTEKFTNLLKNNTPFESY